MENKSAGSSFLKVCGILMIIGGIFGLIFSVLAIVAMKQPELAELNSTVVWISIILALIGSVIELIAGIMGVKNANKPEKAKACLICGLLVILTSVLSQIISVVGGGEFSVSSLITGLLVPVLYVFGAYKNQKG